MKEGMFGIASYPNNWMGVKVVLESFLLQVTEENPLVRIYWNILNRILPAQEMLWCCKAVPLLIGFWQVFDIVQVMGFQKCFILLAEHFSLCRNKLSCPLVFNKIKNVTLRTTASKITAHPQPGNFPPLEGFIQLVATRCVCGVSSADL